MVQAHEDEMARGDTFAQVVLACCEHNLSVRRETAMVQEGNECVWIHLIDASALESLTASVANLGQTLPHNAWVVVMYNQIHHSSKR